MINELWLEECEIAALSDLYNGRRQLSDINCRVLVKTLKNGVAFSTARTNSAGLNRVLGAAVNRPICREDLREFISYYRSQRVENFCVQLAPGKFAKESELELIRSGFNRQGAWAKCSHSLQAPATTNSDWQITKINREQAQEFAALNTETLWPRHFSALLEDTVGRTSWHHFGVIDQGKLMSTVAWYCSKGVAWVGMSVTRAGFRNRGAQIALYNHIVSHAQNIGCTASVLETVAPAECNPSLRNAIRAGYKVAYERPNFIYNRPRGFGLSRIKNTLQHLKLTLK